MSKKFGKKSLKPLFEIKKPKIAFNQEEDKEQEQKLLTKMTKFRVHTHTKYKKDINLNKKQKAVENQVKTNFLKETFVQNPYSHIQKEKEFQEENDLLLPNQNSESKLIDSQLLQSKNLKDLELELQKQLNKNSGYKPPVLDPIQNEYQQLQGTRGLTKFDCWGQDLDPQDWIEICKNDNKEAHAKCPYFKDGAYIWVDVKVLSYDQETKRFLVEVLGLEKPFQKKVNRLSLYFLNEDYQKFKERVKQCKFYQQKAENKIQFIKYIESIDNNHVSPMPTNMIHIILKKLIGNPRNIQDYQKEQVITSKMIRIIRTEYLREMKKCYVLEEMKDPVKLEIFKQRKIQIERKSKNRIDYTIILNSDIKKSFSSKLDSLIQKNNFKHENIQKAIKLFQQKSYEYKKTVLLNLNVINNQLPFDLSHFLEIQQEYFNKTKESLLTQWKEYPLGDICDLLRKVPFYQSAFNDIEEYNNQVKNSLQRLIQRIDLSFRNHLRNFFSHNINKWTEFLKMFVLPQESEKIWNIQENSFIKIELKFRENKKKKKSKEESKELIFFQHNQIEVLNQLKQPIKWMTSFMNSIEKLESDIVKVLGIPQISIFKLDEKYEDISRGYERIQEYLDRAFEQPNQVISEFRKFNFLLENSAENIIKSYTDNIKGKQSVQDLQDYLEKVIQSITEINHLYCNNFKTSFFCIQTAELKDNLIQRASQIKIGFLKKVSEIVIQDIKDINEQYIEMEEQLKIIPESEEQLKRLNENITLCDARLDKLEQDIENTYSYILLMERYGQKFEPNEMYKFWFLKISPLEVKKAHNDAKRVSQEKEQYFVNYLEDEKKNFERDIASFKVEFEKLKNYSEFSRVNEYAKNSNDLGTKLDSAKDKRQNFNEREAMFNIPKSLYENLDKLIEDFKPYRTLWDKAVIFDNSKETWFTQSIVKLQAKKISNDLEKIKKEVSKNLSLKFQHEANSHALNVCNQLVEEIKIFEKNLPLIQNLTQDCMTKKPVNWKNLFSSLSMKVSQQNATLRYLITNGVDQNMDQIEEFVERAAKEYKLEEELNKNIIEQMDNLQLSLIFNKPTNSYLVDKVEEIQEKLDEFLSSIMMMKQNRQVKPIKKKVLEVEKKLIGMQDLLEDWIKCQRSWLYLKPIFISEDLKKKMPIEKQKFDNVDLIWEQIMSQIQQNPKIFENFDYEKTKLDFEQANQTLDEVQKSLSEYLEAKRSDFPRFYFLSDDELIEIISKTKDPTLVTKYLSKCFEGINSLEFTNKDEIISVLSEEGEKIYLYKPINVNQGEKKGAVEKWLAELESVMQTTMQIKVKECMQDIGTERGQWIKKWPGQIILAINSAKWTSDVESSILDASLLDYQKTMQKELSIIVDQVRKPLQSLERKTLEALIVIDVHANYVVNELIAENISSIEQFSWISQLRYHMNKKDLLEVLIITSNYPYQYEYLGNSSRLVITPLTDRCYRTLMNAFQYYYGGAPEGPAGTGKTETVKDLAKAVAVQCNVFNCTDQINYVAMRKFFKGLAQTGSWCCFDEFNRILPEVLSVIAVQVRMIQNAIKENKKTFFFEGKNIRLIPSCAINITMNPGYQGRAELPDNLKALFRPCAMMVPDYSLIAEICLYSYGFQEANKLSKKIVMALKLSSEQLSSQKHYDFGMRALKSILVAAGNLKKQKPDSNENELCLQALNNVNLPKFTRNDIPLFSQIISDLFPDVVEPKQDWSKLIQKMKEACDRLGLIQQEIFIKKGIEIYEMILVRHGLMVVGSTMSGKTNCLKVLQEGISNTDKPVQSLKINPKAVTGYQLYGFLNPDTKAWTEGVIPQVMKECERDKEKEEYKWVVFDGPVDAEWIENMNTVLDDNKVLCLTSGQKIKLTNWMTMMFEVEDLQSASPATVSRCGMIFMEPIQLGWKTLIQKFIKYEISKDLFQFEKTIIYNLLWFYSSCLAFIKKYCKLPLELNEMNIIKNSLTVFDIILKEYESQHGFKNFPKDFENKISELCLFAVIWGFGGILEQQQRKMFNDFLLQLIYYVDIREECNLDVDLDDWEPRGLPVKFINSKNLYTYKLDIETMQWVNWIDQNVMDMSEYVSFNFEDLIIPTRDSERNSYFLNKTIQYGYNILMTGPTGTGKTVGAKSIVYQYFENDRYANIQTNFSGQTLVNSVQRQVESKMTTRKGRKGFWGPEENKEKLIVFIDDVNMPAKETYGAQPPIELLRMWLDYNFWYDLETKEEKNLLGIQWITTMGPPSSGRNTITARFMSHFFLLYVISFDDESMKQIYEAILDWHFLRSSPKFMTSIMDTKGLIVKSSIDVFNKLKITKDFLPTPKKSHYIFSMRDITRIFQTISKSTFRSCKGKEDFVKLWAFESTRVFMDRLVSKEDRQTFQQILKDVIKTNFDISWEKIVVKEPLLFGDFIPIKVKEKDQEKDVFGIYHQLENHEMLKQIFEKYLTEYNEEQADKLDLVMFMEAIEHVIKIIRVITTPNSHCLLVGLGGLGRKSLSSLACYIAKFKLRTIRMTNIYGYKEWVSDIQEILKYAGAENQETVFLFRDSEIFSEDILEELSSLLQQGEVPGIFPNDEKIKIIEDISNNYDTEVEGMTNNQKLDFFKKKCKKNLNLCLCFSPVGEDFRRRLRNFPAFINNTTIDWFLEWPEEALSSVAIHFLESVMPEEKISQLSEICVQMQKDVTELAVRFYEELRRYYYVTPTSYLELLSMITKVYNGRKKQIEDNIQRYEKGVNTLKDAKVKVDSMKQDIIELTPKLEAANKETAALIVTVEKEQLEVDDKKQKVEEEEKVCNKNRESAIDLKQQCQSDLDKVEPLLIEASKNLKSIQRSHIDFIKQIKNPLPPIKKLFQGLCSLYDIKNIPKIKDPNDQFKKLNDYTTPARNIIMAKPDKMLQELLSYNADSINAMNPEIIKQLKILEQDQDFDLAAITKVSEAAGKIAGFLLTIIEIYDKLQIINPKREALKQAESELKEAEEILVQKQQDLAILIQKINSLKSQLEEAKQKKDYLQSEMERCNRQKNAAEELLAGLDGERQQWEKNIIDLINDQETLIGDVVLSSGIMAYLGIFPVNYREDSIKKWRTSIVHKDIKITENYELRNIMSNEIIIGNWTNKFQLPNDSYSIDNAIMMSNSNRFCIMIDPQNQANRWLKEMEKENNLVILKPNRKSNEVQNILQQAIEGGIPILFENLEEKLDYNVTCILKNERKVQNKKIKFKFIEWFSLSSEFKFYGTTKLAKPHYSPDICVMTTLLNFQVTPLGLEDQMLNILVAKEDPSSEKMRINNIKEFYELKKKQKQTEANILSMLTQSGEKNILDDVDLISALKKSKEDSHTAAQRIKVIESMKKKLQNTRNFYSKAANRASNLFFCVTDLSNVEPMYQFSLDWFIDLYKQSLISENKNKQTRVQEIIESFTTMLFRGIQNSLFEKDKLLFSFLIYLKTLECENLTNLFQLRKLFVGATKIQPKTNNILQEYLSDKQWAELEELQQTEQSFDQLFEGFRNHKQEWINYICSQDFSISELPKFMHNISDIAHLMLVRILKPDQLIPLIQRKIQLLLGNEYVDFQTFNIEQLYLKTKNNIPIIFILKQGAEPLGDIERLSEILGKGKNVDVLSLGQGQEKNARKFLEFAMQKGRWIVLQNCHIAPKFLIEIEKLIENVENTEFRLWLTSMPTDTFPVTLLQKGIKVTSEPPRGIKSNLLKSFGSYTAKLVENHPKSEIWKKLLFGITFFHSIVQERRKFASLGWNIPYEFSQMDLIISLTQTHKMLKDFEDIPWETLVYSIAEANYGGRVTDPRDRRLIKVILKSFMSEKTIKSDHKFSTDGIYFCPEETDIKGYKKFISDNFPYKDMPDIFGLHQNAEITSGIKETNIMLNTLLELLPRVTSSSGISIDQQIITTSKEIIDKIPHNFDLDIITKKFPLQYKNSMNTVLVQELMRYNKLINKIKTTLDMLIKAIEGFVIMTDELEEIYNKMLNNQVSDSWHSVSYPSVKPLTSWIINFLKRIEFMQNWIDDDQPSSFWISGFFFTQSFLTGLLQNYARKYKYPIDTLDFDFKLLEDSFDITQPPKNGGYIYGLYLEGARWNSQTRVLQDSEPKILFTQAPHIHIIPMKIEDIQNRHIYLCPVYKTSTRAGTLSTTGHSTNFVISITIPLSQKDTEEYWIKRGVAMLCELDN